jgi:hypothetical protein
MGTLEKFAEAMDELVAMDPSQLADPETVLELQRRRDQYDAVVTRAVAAFDASGEWRASRSRSAGDWLAWKTNMAKATAARQVQLGRAVREMPVAEEAWLAGEIGSCHVAQLARAAKNRTAEAFTRDEKLLVDDAKTLSYQGFYRVMKYWLQHADPDGAEDQAQSKRDRRGFDFSRTFDDMFVGDLTLDPITGTIVSNELNRLERQLFQSDWAEAKERLGREPGVWDLARTPRQRRADALMEMAIRSRTAPANGRRPEPLFTILVGYETFAGPICELANRVVVTPGTLVPWLDQAWVERVVFESRSRVTDVGVTQRLFGGGTRRAVEVRDQQCFHDTCEEPAESCQIDHIDPYGAGGPTTVANGQVACGFHNRDRQRRT